jgi:hypothetical protein
VSQQHYGEGVLPTDPQRRHTYRTSKKFDQLPPERDYSYSIPLGAIPLLATEFHDYGEVLKKVASKANQVYRDFLKSDEGRNFTGQVLNKRINVVLCITIIIVHNTTIDVGY